MGSQFPEILTSCSGFLHLHLLLLLSKIQGQRRTKVTIIERVRLSLMKVRGSRCPTWTYKLPSGQKFSLKLPSFAGFHRKGLKFSRKTPVYKLPEMQFIKHPASSL